MKIWLGFFLPFSSTFFFFSGDTKGTKKCLSFLLKKRGQGSFALRFLLRVRAGAAGLATFPLPAPVFFLGDVSTPRGAERSCK